MTYAAYDNNRNTIPQHSYPGFEAFLRADQAMRQRMRLSIIEDLNGGQAWAGIGADEALPKIPNAQFVRVYEDKPVGFGGAMPWDRFMENFVHDVELLTNYLENRRNPVHEFYHLDDHLQETLFHDTSRTTTFCPSTGELALDLTYEDKMALSAYWTTGLGLKTGPETGYVVVEHTGYEALHATHESFGKDAFKALHRTVRWSACGTGQTPYQFSALFAVPKAFLNKVRGNNLIHQNGEGMRIYYQDDYALMPPSFQIDAKKSHLHWINKPSQAPILRAPNALLDYMVGVKMLHDPVDGVFAGWTPLPGPSGWLQGPEGQIVNLF